MSQHQQTMTILYSLYNKCQNVKKINSHPENLSSATNRSDKGTFSGSSEKKSKNSFLLFSVITVTSEKKVTNQITRFSTCFSNPFI